MRSSTFANAPLLAGLIGLFGIACNGDVAPVDQPEGGASGGASGTGGSASTTDAGAASGGAPVSTGGKGSGAAASGGAGNGSGGAAQGSGGTTTSESSDAAASGGAVASGGGTGAASGGSPGNDGGANSAGGAANGAGGTPSVPDASIGNEAGGAPATGGAPNLGGFGNVGGFDWRDAGSDGDAGADADAEVDTEAGADTDAETLVEGGTGTDASSAGPSDAAVAYDGGGANHDAAHDGGSAVVVNGPSCAGLARTCGKTGDEDCCASSVVPAGTFIRDNGVSGNYPATVSAFRLDKYEVTVGRFRKFIEAYPGSQPIAGSGANPHVPSDPGWNATWNSALPASQAAFEAAVKCTIPAWQDYTLGDDALPMNCIDWYEAYAFCIWDGGRLPTELEWNYAAAGGSEQRPYPWSTSPTDKTISSAYAVYAPAASVFADVGSTSPLGDGRWGQADLSGNVMEWVRDWRGAYPATCDDCAFAESPNVLPAAYRMTRGGGAGDPAYYQLTSTRWYWNAPTFRTDVIGVRCARNVE